MTPQELKNSILQLAIQGKLVEQRAEEGTAEELFARIQQEKQRLIAEKKIKKEKPLPEITEDEKSFEIPESWKWVRLGDIVSLSDERQKGKMYYDGGRLSVVERSAANRRARYAFLSRLKKFLNKIPSRSCPADISSTRSEIKGAIDQLVSKQKLYCERETLSITQKTPGGVLVTDDQLLYGMASVNGISNIGLTGFFSSANFRWDKLLAVSKQLNHINFLNYLPLQLYKQIVDQMLKSDADKRNASAEIFEWLRNDSENTPVHENVILRLFRDVYDNKLNYLNPGNYLGNLAISIFEQRNPGFIKKSISEFLGSLESIKQHQDN